MWLHTYYCTVALLLTYAVSQNNYKIKSYQPTQETETIFSDVIKNISRVNNVLQELINNYEQIQKIYKSQEIYEKDYSSDAEVDEIFKGLKHSRKDKPRSVDKERPTKKPSNNEYFPATQMIWSEDESLDEERDKTSKEEDINNVTEEKVDIVDELENGITSSTEKQPIVSNEESSRDSESELAKDKLDENNKGPEIVFIDTHKKIAPAKNKTNKNIALEFAVEVSKKPQTRYSKVPYIKTNEKNRHRNKNEKRIIKNSKFMTRDNNTRYRDSNKRNIKKLVYTETFSPKSIWKEIIKNKPIQLEPHDEITYDTKLGVAGVKSKPTLRSGMEKTALVIVTKNNKNIQPEDSLESDEEEDITEDMFETNVLRQAYGDACMKVVVRKCFKACKLVVKIVCTRYKCKGQFKQKFKQYSKTGCLKEFKGIHNKTINMNSTTFRGQDDKEVTDGFVDATRSGYLDAVCVPFLQEEQQTSAKKGTPSFPRSPTAKHVNILRDKYERACQRASAKKCAAACHFAYKNTCDIFHCDKKRLRAFKKDCKKKCNSVYTTSSRVSSSDSDSDGDTEIDITSGSASSSSD